GCGGGGGRRGGAVGGPVPRDGDEPGRAHLPRAAGAGDAGPRRPAARRDGPRRRRAGDGLGSREVLTRRDARTQEGSDDRNKGGPTTGLEGGRMLSWPRGGGRAALCLRPGATQSAGGGTEGLRGGGMLRLPND